MIRMMSTTTWFADVSINSRIMMSDLEPTQQDRRATHRPPNRRKHPAVRALVRPMQQVRKVLAEFSKRGQPLRGGLQNFAFDLKDLTSVPLCQHAHHFPHAPARG